MYTTNHLPKPLASKSATGCCPPFNAARWDGETFRFDRKLFLKVTTRSFMHMPLNMGSVFKKAMKLVEAAHALDETEPVILSLDVSPWKVEHYIAVTKEVPNGETVHLTGTYVARVFEGPYRKAGIWYRQLADYIKRRGEKLIRTYFYYTTCPKCARAYGKNYVVGFAQVK